MGSSSSYRTPLQRFVSDMLDALPCLTRTIFAKKGDHTGTGRMRRRSDRRNYLC